MSNILGIPAPTNLGPTFWTTSQFNGNWTAYIFRVKHDIHKRTSALQTTRGLLHRTKTIWTLVHKRLKTGPGVLPTLTIYAIASGGFKWQYVAIIATFSSLFCVLTWTLLYCQRCINASDEATGSNGGSSSSPNCLGGGITIHTVIVQALIQLSSAVPKLSSSSSSTF